MTFKAHHNNQRKNPDIIITVTITDTTLLYTIQYKQPLGKPGYSRPFIFQTITLTVDLSNPNSTQRIEQTIVRTLNKAWQIQH